MFFEYQAVVGKGMSAGARISLGMPRDGPYCGGGRMYAGGGPCAGRVRQSLSKRHDAAVWPSFAAGVEHDAFVDGVVCAARRGVCPRFV